MIIRIVLNLALALFVVNTCLAMEEDNNVSADNTNLPTEIHFIILSDAPASCLVYAFRVSKAWQELVLKVLESYPEKYLELCEIGFEKKKYSKLLDPIFTNPTRYKKFIHYVLQAPFKKNLEIDEKAYQHHKQELLDKVAELKTEKPEDLFALAWFAHERPSDGIFQFQNFTHPEKPVLKRVLVLLISLGAPLSIIKNVDGCEEAFEAGYQLFKQCMAPEFSEQNFQAVLKNLDEHYIVTNFFVNFDCYKNIDYQYSIGSPLYFAMQAKNQGAAKLLVTEGFVHVNLSIVGQVPLAKACYLQLFDIAEFLIKNGASLSIKLLPYNRLLAESMADKGNSCLDAIKLLVKHKAPLGRSLDIAKKNKQKGYENFDKMIKYLEGLPLTGKTEGE